MGNENSKVQELQKQLDILRGGIKTDSVWDRLTKKCSGLTEQEIASVYSNKKVKSSKDKMFDVFVNYFLFEKYKNEFSSHTIFKKFVDDYVDSVCDVVDNRNSVLHNENEELKKRIAELEASVKGVVK